MMKSIGILSSSSAFSTLLIFICTPILARIYSPSEFEIYSIILYIVAIISPSASLRLNLAINISPHQNRAHSMLLITLITNLITSILILIIFFLLFLYEKHVVFLSPSLIIITSFLILFASCYQATINYAARFKEYNAIALSRIIRSIILCCVQLYLGFRGFGVLGLLVGQLFYFSVGYFIIINKIKLNFKLLPKRYLCTLVNRYREFIYFSFPESLLNSIAVNVPPLLIALLLPGYEGALLAVATRFVGTPVELLSQAITHTYLGGANKNLKQNNLSNITKKYMYYTFIAAITLLPIGVFILTKISNLILGEQWDGINNILILSLPAFILQLSISPFVVFLTLTEQLKESMFLQSANAIFRVSTIAFALMIIPDHVIFVHFMTISICYLVIFGVIMKNMKYDIYHSIY